MSTATEVPPKAIVTLLEADLAQPREWDGWPELHLIYGHTFGYVMVPMLVPLGLWEAAGHPVQVLWGIAEMARRTPMLVARMVAEVNVPGGGLLLGLALRAEAWMGEDMAEEEADQVDAGKLLIRDLPDRFEVRFSAAADVAGTHYMVNLKRADGTITSAHTGADGDLEAAAGRVPEALAECLQGLLHAQGAMYS